jgi:hypothetical protein
VNLGLWLEATNPIFEVVYGMVRTVLEEAEEVVVVN